MSRSFRSVASLSELVEGQGRRVVVDGHPIALFKVSGEVHAIDHRCPHQGGPLANGFVHNCRVTCPLHGWVFDLRTGKEPDQDGKVAVHDVRVVGDDVQVAINS